MKAIVGYIRQYLEKAHLLVHVVAILFLSVLVFANYALGINQKLQDLSPLMQMAGWYILLLAAFATPYLLYRYFQPLAFEWRQHFKVLLFAAPLVFAWKMTAKVHLFSGFSDAGYWNQVAYFPAKVVVCCAALYLLRRWAGRDHALMGLRTPLQGMRPYGIMLLIMVPLIFLAGTQPDFQRVYPKLQHAIPSGQSLSIAKLLLFEAAYGSDFFTIELFFRGFLVIYFARWAGRYAILPMAVFYCVIHFGKPLGECISSFFGGMLLGIVSYRTQSIWGGLAVHLGIAWLMELAGWMFQ